jgi:hypothetical protein
MEKRKYREYSEQDLRNACAKVQSLASLLRELNLKAAGGNYIHMRKLIQEHNIDCSHWTGQGWNKDKQLKDWTQYTKIAQIKKHLIKEKGHKCEYCNLESWLDYPITLEVHHKDGDRTNNDFINLQLLCCNCHATTDNWRNKKRNEKISSFF